MYSHIGWWQKWLFYNKGTIDSGDVIVKHWTSTSGGHTPVSGQTHRHTHKEDTTYIVDTWRAYKSIHTVWNIWKQMQLFLLMAYTNPTSYSSKSDSGVRLYCQNEVSAKHSGKTRIRMPGHINIANPIDRFRANLLDQAYGPVRVWL